MKNKKLVALCASVLLATNLVLSTPVQAATNVDLLYKNAYTATNNALKETTQGSINIARAEVKKLPINLNWAIGEFSKQLDSLQHPILSTIILSIKLAETNLIQANIDQAKSSIPNELYPIWKNSYSSAIDKLQQKLQIKALNALKKAENEKTEESIKLAEQLISELMSSNSVAIEDWSNSLFNRLKALGGVRVPSSPADSIPKPLPPNGIALKPRIIERYLESFDIDLYSTAFGDARHGANYRPSSHNFEIQISDRYISFVFFKNNSQDVATIKALLKMSLPTAYEEVYNLSRKPSMDCFIYRDNLKIQIYNGNITIDYEYKF